ncbi:kinesin-like protein KIN-14A isoform X1 [Miscanthus floridulus]|uniref:kinesin-like protein KIN-14A isoform X1 n=1 Tax=Miscanthus floridulus TaxID=154761 RepID=UPI00345A8A45
MTEPRRLSFRDGRLASRKAEEAALRRHQAAAWLQAMVGSFGLAPYPSEQEFVASLRNGIVLCKAINKLQPGAVAKIITNAPCDSQPLTAFQYFENIRNFLVAVNKLKLPSFEASDLDKDNLDAGTVGKIVDCVISLKSYHEWKQAGGANGPIKYMKSPLAVRSSHIQSENVALGPSPSQKCLYLTEADADTLPFQNVDPNMKEAVEKLQKVIVDSMLSYKENFDQDILKKDPTKLIGAVLANQLGKEQLLSPEKLMVENEPTHCIEHSNSQIENKQLLLQAHETELLDLKKMFQDVKVNFRCLQTQFLDDMAKLGENIQDLSKAALGYNQAVKENRNLYNMLQELRGNIRVFCRIRPLLNSESISSIEHIGTDGSVMVCDPVKPQSARKIFQFNKVFGPTTTQDEVYKETQPLVRSVMDGYNVCIFAYGQTGSGKTHTMCGPSGGLSKDFGINYRALNDLFNISTSREDVKYDIRVQMVEIYNEQVRDLLNENRSSTKLDIRASLNNGLLNLPDAKICPVQSPSDVINLMQLGEKHRASGSTAINHRSSRSHSILTVHVNGKDIAGNVSRSSLHLVDLAGSERVDRSEATGDRLKEAQHINKSLSCLGDVINALAQKNSHIPYRNSKLTQLLQSSLGGNAKTLMFSHISPEAESCAETLSTLKFAQRASTVELGTAHANKESSEIRELKEQVDTLKKALASKELEKSSLKLKENATTSERTKQVLDRTPPRPRRLSLENASSDKARMPERKILKSPRSAMGITHDKECNTDGFRHTNHHESLIKMPVTCAEDLVREEEKIICTVDTVEFCQLPSEVYNLLKQSGLNTPEAAPCRSRNLCTEASCGDAPSTAKLEKIMTGTAVKKGSHLRKSIQSSIGRLIHGTERRNVQHSAQGTPTKITANACHNIASPVTADIRLRRRQSLTGIPPPPSTMSRRSSLGGKSDTSIRNSQTTSACAASKYKPLPFSWIPWPEQGSNDKRGAKTPPPVNSAAKAKR